MPSASFSSGWRGLSGSAPPRVKWGDQTMDDNRRSFAFGGFTKGWLQMAEARIVIDTGTNELLCEIRDRVALITLNRPEARNALSDDLTPALRRMIKQCGDDPSVGALLITGTGTAFCAGGDVKGMGNNSNKAEVSLEDRVADLKSKQRTLTGALAAVRKP